MAVNPGIPKLRNANYDENATFGDIVAIFRYLIENHIRYSLTTPPLIKDVKEGTVVIDKTQARLYFNVNNTLRYIAMV